MLSLTIRRGMALYVGRSTLTLQGLDSEKVKLHVRNACAQDGNTAVDFSVLLERAKPQHLTVFDTQKGLPAGITLVATSWAGGSVRLKVGAPRRVEVTRNNARTKSGNVAQGGTE